MESDPKRKAHTKEVLRELFAKSGNLCAMPGCGKIMVTARGNFVGQICHIEGVKGERYRKGMTADELAAVANLLLLCYEHHIETNDEATWPVARMRQLKADHEALFTDPSIRMYQAYVDQTDRGGRTKAVTVERFFRVLGWDLEPERGRETANEINALFDRVAKLDVQTRLFICAVVERAERVRNTANVQDDRGDLLLRWDDFTNTHGVDDQMVKQRLEALFAHHIGGHSDMDIDDRRVDAISLYATENGWSFWQALGQFCAAAAEKLEPIVVDIDLSRLD